MLRITPDVNMLVEGTLSRNGPAGAILIAWEMETVELVICDDILAGYVDVLRRPRIQRRYRHVTASDLFRKYGRVVPLDDVPAIVAQDPDDDVILACALMGGVNYIVNRDRHLLNLGIYHDIAIVPPEQFASVLRSTSAFASQRSHATE